MASSNRPSLTSPDEILEVLSPLDDRCLGAVGDQPSQERDNVQKRRLPTRIRADEDVKWTEILANVSQATVIQCLNPSDHCQSSPIGGLDGSPAAMASAIQPTSMATPPIGVMAPSHRRPEIERMYRLPEKDQGAQQERPARRLKRGPAPAGRGKHAHGQDRQGAVHLILGGGLKFASSRSAVSPPVWPPSDWNRSFRPCAPKAPIDTARNPQIAPILIQNPALIVRYVPSDLPSLDTMKPESPLPE